MTTNLSNHRSRASRMQLFFSQNATLLNPHTDITDLIVLFLGYLASFDTEASEQATTMTGNAVAKKAAFDTASTLVCKWGLRCHVKAHQDGNFALETLLNHRPYEIDHLSDNQRLSLMKAMRKGLNDNMSFFTVQGLNSGIISNIDLKIADYEAQMETPSDAIKDHKTDTAAMVSWMSQADTSLADIVSLIEAEFFDTAPEIVENMKNQYRIDDLGHRYNSIEGGLIAPANAPLSNYIITVTGHDGSVKTAKTDLAGHYRIKGLHVGLATVTFKSPAGAELASRVIKVKRGMTLQIDWNM